MAQLRQDNMELRHRLRQSESREFKQPKSVMSPGMTGNAGVAELLAINSKLKRQVESYFIFFSFYSCNLLDTLLLLLCRLFN